MMPAKMPDWLKIASNLAAAADSSRASPACPATRALTSRNVAIDLKYHVIVEKLLPAFYNDFTAILAGVTQFARPVTFISQLRNERGEFDREFCLKQSVATVADRLFRRKAIKLLGPSVPEFNRPI